MLAEGRRTLDLYKNLLRPILFSGLNADPEMMHHLVMGRLSWLERSHQQPTTQWLHQQLHDRFTLPDVRLKQSLWGLNFPNPVGLAAGFDKDGLASGVWSAFGFGFAELGTVTFHAQPGNDRPRLFRLLEDQAVLNRMGFNNRGAAALQAHLAQRWQTQTHPIPLGINLGKSKITDLEAAAEDYRASFRLLKDLGDYFVVNVSSPNTPGLRSLQAAESLEPILTALQAENTQQKPLLVKIAPDLEWEEIHAVLKLAQTHHLSGIIATNTTISRSQLKTQTIQATGRSVTEEAGGISGAPLRQRSTEVIRFIYQETGGQLPIIGVGGIFSAEDAWEKLTAGASLLQVYTGWVYEGPAMMRNVLQGLLHKLDDLGLKSISEAVGHS